MEAKHSNLPPKPPRAAGGGAAQTNPGAPCDPAREPWPQKSVDQPRQRLANALPSAPEATRGQQCPDSNRAAPGRQTGREEVARIPRAATTNNRRPDLPHAGSVSPVADERSDVHAFPNQPTVPPNQARLGARGRPVCLLRRIPGRLAKPRAAGGGRGPARAHTKAAQAATRPFPRSSRSTTGPTPIRPIPCCRTTARPGRLWPGGRRPDPASATMSPRRPRSR